MGFMHESAIQPTCSFFAAVIVDCAFVGICLAQGGKYFCVFMQIAWQNGLTDLAMPFMIQFMKDYVGKVDTLMADRKDNMEARKVCLHSCCHQCLHLNAAGSCRERTRAVF